MTELYQHVITAALNLTQKLNTNKHQETD